MKLKEPGCPFQVVFSVTRRLAAVGTPGLVWHGQFLTVFATAHKKGPGDRAFCITYGSLSDQNLRITAGLKYQPEASNIRVSSTSAQVLEAGTGTLG